MPPPNPNPVYDPSGRYKGKNFDPSRAAVNVATRRPAGQGGLGQGQGRAQGAPSGQGYGQIYGNGGGQESYDKHGNSAGQYHGQGPAGGYDRGAPPPQRNSYNGSKRPYQPPPSPAPSYAVSRQPVPPLRYGNGTYGRQEVSRDRTPPPVNFVTGQNRNFRKDNAHGDPGQNGFSGYEQQRVQGFANNGHSHDLGMANDRHGATNSRDGPYRSQEPPHHSRFPSFNQGQPPYHGNGHGNGNVQPSRGHSDKSSPAPHPSNVSTPSRPGAVHPSRMTQVPYADVVRATPNRADGPARNLNGSPYGQDRAQNRPPPIDIDRAAIQAPGASRARDENGAAQNGPGNQGGDNRTHGQDGAISAASTTGTGATAMAGRFLNSEHAVPITPATRQVMRSHHTQKYNEVQASAGESFPPTVVSTPPVAAAPMPHLESNKAETRATSNTEASASTPTPASKMTNTSKQEELRARLMAMKRGKSAASTAASPASRPVDLAGGNESAQNGPLRRERGGPSPLKAQPSTISTDTSVVTSTFGGALPHLSDPAPSRAIPASEESGATADKVGCASANGRPASLVAAASSPDQDKRVDFPTATASSLKREREPGPDIESPKQKAGFVPEVNSDRHIEDRGGEARSSKVNDGEEGEIVSPRPSPKRARQSLAPHSPGHGAPSGSGRSKRSSAADFMVDEPTEHSPAAPPGNVEDEVRRDQGQSTDPAAQERARVWREAQRKAKENEIARVREQIEQTRRDMAGLEGRGDAQGAKREKSAVYRARAPDTASPSNLADRLGGHTDGSNPEREEAVAGKERRPSLLDRMAPRDEHLTNSHDQHPHRIERERDHEQHGRRESWGAHNHERSPVRRHDAKPYDRPRVPSDAPERIAPAPRSDSGQTDRVKNLVYTDKFGAYRATPVPVGPQDGYDGYSYATRAAPSEPVRHATPVPVAPEAEERLAEMSPYSKAMRLREVEEARAHHAHQNAPFPAPAPAPAPSIAADSQTNEVMQTLALLKAQIARLEASLPSGMPTATLPNPEAAALVPPPAAPAISEEIAPVPRARAPSVSVHPDRLRQLPSAGPAPFPDRAEERHNLYDTELPRRNATPSHPGVNRQPALGLTDFTTRSQRMESWDNLPPSREPGPEQGYDSLRPEPGPYDHRENPAGAGYGEYRPDQDRHRSLAAQGYDYRPRDLRAPPPPPPPPPRSEHNPDSTKANFTTSRHPYNRKLADGRVDDRHHVQGRFNPPQRERGPDWGEQNGAGGGMPPLFRKKSLPIQQQPPPPPIPAYGDGRRGGHAYGQARGSYGDRSDMSGYSHGQRDNGNRDSSYGSSSSTRGRGTSRGGYGSRGAPRGRGR